MTGPAHGEEITADADQSAPCATRYRGRFAPSPSGPLHFGSLVAALASFLEARQRQGEWLLRIEDIDAPRNVPGAADGLLRDLERLGLHWDGDVILQNTNSDRHRHALHQLARDLHCFPCACSRREAGPGPYPGTCRQGIAQGKTARSVRMRVCDAQVSVLDRIQGIYHQSLEHEVGDFVVARADGIMAYNLAVAVDDAHEGITDVVRGSDLLSSTPRQIHIMHALTLNTPSYAHVPVATHASGQKLSKQTHAPSIALAEPGLLLVGALSFLGQHPPTALSRMVVAEILDWAIQNWRMAAVPRKMGQVWPLTTP